MLILVMRSFFAGIDQARIYRIYERYIFVSSRVHGTMSGRPLQIYNWNLYLTLEFRLRSVKVGSKYVLAAENFSVSEAEFERREFFIWKFNSEGKSVLSLADRFGV